MCCFTQAVDQVSDTSIFARGLNGRQVIVYSMAYSARSALAMVLPLPVPPGSPDDAIRFISFEEYPEFFTHIGRAFQEWTSRGGSVMTFGLDEERAPLAVHEVGDFEASFVPALKDFDRLDARFRIPRTVWDELPTYQDYGFAVFKLKASTRGVVRRLVLGSRATRMRKIHPIAFEFPRRQPGLLYFPTLHVHDRAVHPGADFNHALYCQPEPGWDHTVLEYWDESPGPAVSYLDVSKTREVIVPEAHLFRLRLDGHRQNKDTWVSVNAMYPELIHARRDAR